MAVRQRPAVLTFVDYYLPGFKGGGPIRTVEHMVEQLSDTFEFYIVTSDRDLGDDVPYDNIVTDAWNEVGKAHAYYRSPGISGWRAMLSEPRVRKGDLVYMCGIFSLNASLRPLMYWRLGRFSSAPALVAPMGELSSGALNIRWRKKMHTSRSPAWAAFSAMCGGIVPIWKRQKNLVCISALHPKGS